MRRIIFVALIALTLVLSAWAAKTADTAIEPTASALPNPTDAPASTAGAEVIDSYAQVDLDLSEMSGTAVYAQVFNMLERPGSYLNKVICVRGALNYYKNEKNGNEYFAVLIADATACCAQGLEFVWAGEHVYPRDYPELGTEITVTGRFELYNEDAFTYVHLNDVDVKLG